MAKRKIGVLGGTFDPIHYGHLAAAEEARVRLGLDKVIFVVARIPPLKQDEPLSLAEDRLKMVELAVASNPYFEASRMEIDRPGPSYTVDTISLLKQVVGPDAEIYFIMGFDALLSLPQWKDPQKLAQLCRLVAVNRPGYHAELTELEGVIPSIAQRTMVINTPAVDISSSDIRERMKKELPIKYQVPPPVEDYIYSHGLYR